MSSGMRDAYAGRMFGEQKGNAPGHERLSAPPPGTFICGGAWEKMNDDAREEVWDFHDYLADGGKRVHGSYTTWRSTLRRQRPASEGNE